MPKSFHVHARLFKGTLEKPTINEFQTKETPHQHEAIQMAQDTAELGFQTWVFELTPGNPPSGKFRCIAEFDTGGLQRDPKQGRLLP